MISFAKNRGNREDTERKEPNSPKQKINGERNIKLSKQRIQRIVSWAIISLIVLSIFFNVVFFSKYHNISNDVQVQKEEIEQELNKVEENKAYSSDKVIHFTKEFLREYISISEDDETRNSQAQLLETYFYDGFDVNTLYNVNDFNGSRTLKSIEYVEKSVDENKIIDVVFEITYDLTSIENFSDEEKTQLESEIRAEVKKDDDIKDKKVDEEVAKRMKKEEEERTSTDEHTTMIKVPIMAKNKGYAVIEKPKEIDTKLVADVSEDDVTEREYKGEELTQSDISEFNTTLNDFFTAYGKDNENVRLISNFDGGIGEKELVEFNVLKAFSFNEKDQSKITAVVDVKYQDENTNLITTNNYTVTLLYYDDRYIVDNIK